MNDTFTQGPREHIRACDLGAAVNAKLKSRIKASAKENLFTPAGTLVYEEISAPSFLKRIANRVQAAERPKKTRRRPLRHQQRRLTCRISTSRRASGHQEASGFRHRCPNQLPGRREDMVHRWYIHGGPQTLLPGALHTCRPQERRQHETGAAGIRIDDR